jgi:hypothetical protein
VIDVALFLEAIDVSLEAAVNIFDLGLFEGLERRKKCSKSQERGIRRLGNKSGHTTDFDF